MKVRDLIELLQAEDPERLVLVDGHEGGFDDPHVETATVLRNSEPGSFLGAWEDAAYGGELVRPEAVPAVVVSR